MQQTFYLKMGAKNVLIKGGHLDSNIMQGYFF